MVLEGVIIIPWWSASSVPTIVIVVLFLLEFLSQTKAIFHLVFGVLVQGARTVQNLFVLLVVVTLCARLIDVGNKVIWSAAAILTRFESVWPITSVVLVETTVVVAAIIVLSVVVAVVVAVNIVLSIVVAVVMAARRAISARVFVKTHLRFLGVGVLIGCCDHLTDAGGWLSIELRTEFSVMKSSDEGSDDFSLCDVGNRIPHLGEASDVATEEFGRLLGDAVEVVLGAWPPACGHVVVGEDSLQIFPRADGVRGEACEPTHGGWREHDREIVCHDVGVSPGGSDGGGVSL